MSNAEDASTASAERPEPTPRETEILQVLWERGPSTVREVYRALAANEGSDAKQRTTVLKLMQIMLEKGLVLRDETVSPHLYSAALERAAAEQRLVDRFAKRVFDGSSLRLVVRAIESGDLTSSELEEIRRLIDEHEQAGEP